MVQQLMAALLVLALVCDGTFAMGRHHRTRGKQFKEQAARKNRVSKAVGQQSAVPLSGTEQPSQALFCCSAPGMTSLCRASGSDGDVERTDSAEAAHEGICPDTSVTTGEPAKRTDHVLAGDADCTVPGAEAAVTQCGGPILTRSYAMRERDDQSASPTLTRSNAFRIPSDEAGTPA